MSTTYLDSPRQYSRRELFSSARQSTAKVANERQERLDAIKPLTTEQKQTLYLAAIVPDADFEDGLDALITADPTLEAPLQAAIEPCV